MASKKDWIPKHIDMEEISAARIYDYILGGHHNFEVDRQAANQLLNIWSGVKDTVLANRAFLRRATAFYLDEGIDQFIDIGSGIPTEGHVHELVLPKMSDAGIVYVDIDPVAVAHSRAILREIPNATVIQADARHPDDIFGSDDLKSLIDLSRPVGVYLLTLIHFVPDVDRARAMLEKIEQALAPGSYLAITHASTDYLSKETSDKLKSLYANSPNPFVYRSKDEILAIFDGLNLELIEPGLVLIPEWRPDSPDDFLLDTPERASGYAGVWRKL